MNTHRMKTTLAYVLTQNKENGMATLDLLLQSIDDAWIDILVQDAYQNTINTYMLSVYSPSLRQISIEQHTTISLYVKDHWYILAGGILQIRWSSSRKCLELYTLCFSTIDIVEIEQLPLTREEEQTELAKKFAANTLIQQSHFVHHLSEGVKEVPFSKKVEIMSSEEVEVDAFGKNLARGFALVLPKRAWIITSLCSPEDEAPAREQYVLVAYYPTLPPYASYCLSKVNGRFSLGSPYI